MIFSASAFPGDKEEKIQWSDVPAVVQKTITGRRGGKVEEIEKETETKGNKTVTVYEAEVRKPDNEKVETKVGEDGKLIEIEAD